MINQDYIKNNVEAINQAKHSYYIGDLKSKNSFRVLFLGNSITYHEAKKELGWDCNFGMAASSLEKDYVHLVYANLKDKLEKDITAFVNNISFYEWDYLNESHKEKIADIAKSFKPDLIILNIGENIKKVNENFDKIKSSLDDVVGSLTKQSKNLILVNSFWRNDLLNEIFISVAKKYNINLADISDIGDDDRNKALGLFAHEGVSLHPNDLGMKKIAERILNLI